MVWWKRDGKARQPEEPLPEPLPCPVCNGHAEAVIDMCTIGGYAGQDDFWGCRCSVCGYGFFGATGGPRSEREAISRWEILVRNTLDVIAEPLEECPKCHIAPEVKQNVVEGQAFLQCPKCLEAVCGDAPVAVKFKWNRRCRRRQAAKLKAARQARLLERVIGEDVD